MSTAPNSSHVLAGTEFELRHGPYFAVVTARGAALRQLQFHGRDLVVPFESDEAIPDYRGVICAPWPNRIEDGRYSANGQDQQAPVNEPERGAALHGLVFDKLWTPLKRDETSLLLAFNLEPSPAYPFGLQLKVGYALHDDGLHARVSATNTGVKAAPYGVCRHPYLRAGDSPLDTWAAVIPAGQFLEVTPDRLLPLGMASVEGHDFDFRSEKVLGDVKIDHAFTGILRDDSGTAAVRVFDPSGTGVELSWGTEWPWLQIHTADKPVGPDRLGLAVEPMTCPPNAFNSGTDLVVLAPGQSHEAAWAIRALQR